MPLLCNANIISSPALKVVGEDPKEASEWPIDRYRPSRWLIYALFRPMMPFSCPFAIHLEQDIHVADSTPNLYISLFWKISTWQISWLNNNPTVRLKKKWNLLQGFEPPLNIMVIWQFLIYKMLGLERLNLYAKFQLINYNHSRATYFMIRFFEFNFFFLFSSFFIFLKVLKLEAPKSDQIKHFSTRMNFLSSFF